MRKKKEKRDRRDERVPYASLGITGPKSMAKPEVNLTSEGKERIEDYWNLEDPPCKGCSYRFNYHEECSECLFYISERIYVTLLEKPLHISELHTSIIEQGCTVDMGLLDRHLNAMESAKVIKIVDNVCYPLSLNLT